VGVRFRVQGGGRSFYAWVLDFDFWILVNGLGKEGDGLGRHGMRKWKEGRGMEWGIRILRFWLVVS
jgi:hypothetical protein